MITMVKIIKNSIIMNIVMLITLLLLFKDLSFTIAYVFGVIVNYINFAIINNTLVIRNTISAFTKNMLSFIVRMGLYSLVLLYSLNTYDEYHMLITFIGCINIRYAILFTHIFMKGDEI